MIKLPLDPYCHGYLADNLWHLGEREEALQAIIKALELDPNYDWAWRMLDQWAQQLGQDQLPEETVRAMLINRTGDERLWCTLAKFQAETADKLQSLNKAIKLKPRLIAAHEQTIVLLTDQKQFDDAREAVNHPCWQDEIPVSIRGHLPWISRCAGDTNRAIEEMQTLLAQEPDYYDGFRMLADWCDTEQRFDEYYQHSQAMLKLAPNSSHAFSYVGDALQKLDREDEAIPYLEQAAAREPDSTLANFTLFDIYYARKDLPAMQSLMQRMKLHIQDSEYVTAREAALAAMTDNQTLAFACLDQLCLGNNENRWLFDNCINAIKSVGWQEQLLEQLSALISQENCLPRVGAFWGRTG